MTDTQILNTLLLGLFITIVADCIQSRLRIRRLKKELAALEHCWELNVTSFNRVCEVATFWMERVSQIRRALHTMRDPERTVIFDILLADSETDTSKEEPTP